ncbi:MAG: hypothetical protein HOP19_29240 [Acidobacteria bacterium]|nr:hypothetical protein [Acidobacteriota bacterium]
MANCNAVAPGLETTGDDLYGARICDQAFIDWAWDAHDFDEGDWDEGFGFDAVCDMNLPLGRTLAGIWCLNYSAEDYMNEDYGSDILQWGCRYVRENIDELDARCGDGTAFARTQTGGLFVDEWTELYLPFFYEQGVSLRAGTLVHESRHAGGKDHDDGNNDSSWEYNGSWRWQVCWLSWFAARGQRTSEPLKTIARQRANFIIDTHFTTHPGFSV